MGFLSNCSHVVTTEWLHHLDTNEMLGEKVRWRLRNKRKWDLFQAVAMLLLKYGYTTWTQMKF